MAAAVSWGPVFSSSFSFSEGWVRCYAARILSAWTLPSSRLSCGIGDTQLGAGSAGICTDVGHHPASPKRHEQDDNGDGRQSVFPAEASELERLSRFYFLKPRSCPLGVYR